MKNLYLKYAEIIRYLFIGVLTTFVSLLIYYGCVSTILNPNQAIELQIANVISWIGSVLFAYVTNRNFVFHSKEQKKGKEFFSFVGSRVFTLLLDMVMMFFLVTLLHLNDKFIKLLSQVIVIVANYIISKFFVFKKKEQH